MTQELGGSGKLIGRALYILILFFYLFRGPPRSALFPYTTLFRSVLTRRGFLAAAGGMVAAGVVGARAIQTTDRKSTRLNSSHGYISYAVFCLKKKTHSHSVKPVTTQPPVLPALFSVPVVLH